jgi:hypothetical protein
MKGIQNGGMRSLGDASLFVVAVVVSTTELKNRCSPRRAPLQFSDFGRWKSARESFRSWAPAAPQPCEGGLGVERLLLKI